MSCGEELKNNGRMCIVAVMYRYSNSTVGHTLQWFVVTKW